MVKLKCFNTLPLFNVYSHQFICFSDDKLSCITTPQYCSSFPIDIIFCPNSQINVGLIPLFPISNTCFYLFFGCVLSYDEVMINSHPTQLQEDDLPSPQCYQRFQCRDAPPRWVVVLCGWPPGSIGTAETHTGTGRVITLILWYWITKDNT